MMRRTAVILPVAIMVALVASFVHAAEVSIDDAYNVDAHTISYPGELSPDQAVVDFCVWEPVMYVVDYTITGNENKAYKAVIVVKSMGDRLRQVERHKPGTYTTVFTNLPREDDVGPDEVEYRVKLRKGKSDTTYSTINVSDCSAE